MSFFQTVDTILFELCGEAMLDSAERYFIITRRFGVFKNSPANAAFAICEHRAKRRKEVFATS
jgi:hypothetical protein